MRFIFDAFLINVFKAWRKRQHSLRGVFNVKLACSLVLVVHV